MRTGLKGAGADAGNARKLAERASDEYATGALSVNKLYDSACPALGGGGN